MIQWRRTTVDQFERCFPIQYLCRCHVYQVASRKCAVTPKFDRNMSLKRQCPSYIEDVTMLTFHTIVLLWSTNTRSFMNYPLSRKIICQRNDSDPLSLRIVLIFVINFLSTRAIKFLRSVGASFLFGSKYIHTAREKSSRMVRKHVDPQSQYTNSKENVRLINT